MPRFIRNMFYNWKIKLYLLGLAVILWIFVVTSQTYEMMLDIAIVPIDIKPRKIIVSDIPEKATVRFSGTGSDLLIMKYVQLARLELDMHTINYFYDYPLWPEYVFVPTGLSVIPVLVVYPDTVKIILDDEREQLVPVIPQVQVTPAPGYVLIGAVTTIPDSVTISGPRSRVRSIRRVVTEEKTFEGLVQTSNEPVAIALDNPDLEIIPKKVLARIVIDKIAERYLTRIPISAIEIPEGRKVTLEPSRISTRLRGPAKHLATLTQDSVEAYFDLRQWRPDQREYVPEFLLPEGVELIGLLPEMVRVRVEVESEP